MTLVISAATTCYWKNQRINIIDILDTLTLQSRVRPLRVLDGSVTVMCQGVVLRSASPKLYAAVI